MTFQSVSVDFVMIGNRRGLTGQQMVEHPELTAFYQRFKHCFEPAPWNIDAVLFIEPERRVV